MLQDIWAGLPNNQLFPPANDEIEISLFGPGYGESIVVHLGNNDWIVVDSCVGPDKVPVALSYFHRIGVDPSTAVKQVVATHWHDDHIRGLAHMYSACRSAQFVCSQAIKTTDFVTLCRLHGKRAMVETSGVTEFASIIDTLNERNKIDRAREHLRFASVDKTLWSRPAIGGIPSVRVVSLSPSDTATVAALNELAKLIPQKNGTPKRRIASPSHNMTSVVLWVEIGGIPLLLGSDLEETNNPRIGWSIIVNSDNRPLTSAHVLKVAHHGSSNADHPGVWEKMLIPSPFALVTPFRNGRVDLPTREDRDRICGRTSNAYVTSARPAKHRKHPNATVEKQIREVVRSIVPVNPPMGQIQLRAKYDNSLKWSLLLCGAAERLSR